MNTVPVPVGKFTAYPDSVSCHSVSKHRPCAPGRFVVTFVLSAHSAGLSHHRSMVSYSELGPPLKISRLASTLIRHNPPNRVHRRSRMTPCITDWQFASSCSPRSACAAAVTFRYRPVDFGLTGTLTPLRHRLHSRTGPPPLPALGDPQAERLVSAAGDQLHEHGGQVLPGHRRQVLPDETFD